MPLRFDDNSGRQALLVVRIPTLLSFFSNITILLPAPHIRSKLCCISLAVDQFHRLHPVFLPLAILPSLDPGCIV